MAEIVYVGQATMSLGAVPILELPPHYGQPATATVEIRPVVVRWRWPTGSTTAPAWQCAPPGPYAALRIRVPGPAGPTALVAARPSRLERAGTRLVDAAVLLLAGPTLSSMRGSSRATGGCSRWSPWAARSPTRFA